MSIQYKNEYRSLKGQVLKCLRHINTIRDNKYRISGKKIVILKIIKLYKFYKRITLLKKKNTKTLLGKVNTKILLGKVNNTQVIEKNGYKFINIDGKLYKLTKKSYTEDDINNWCNGRKSASDKMKQNHLLKKEEQKKNEETKEEAVTNIYNRECSLYPDELRILIQNIKY